MPESAIARLIDERLRNLYERHVEMDDADVAQFYAPERGYYPVSEAGDERDTFAISLATRAGDLFSAGDHEHLFPLQSISKVFAYALALEDHGREYVLERVGVSPSGDAFNSIEFDERRHQPHNPMVNAGALVATSLVAGGDDDEKLERLVDAMRRYAGNPGLTVDEQKFEREMRAADHNLAIAYLMRSQGMIEGDVEALVALYLRQCSVVVTCDDLAMMAATLGNGGVNPRTGDVVIGQARVRDVLSVMYTCGMYDFAGEWAFDIGVPAKSGVSGGLLAVIPGKAGFAVFSPGLDIYGNSVRATRVCQQVSRRLGLHVFAAEEEDTLLRR